MLHECFKFKDFIVKVKSIEESCPAGYKVGDYFTVESIIPRGLCPFLYHTTLPYIEALENGALFRIRKRNFITVQCPNPKVGVVVNIIKKNHQGVQIGISNTRTKKLNCPYFNLEPGNKWFFDRKPMPFCRKAFDSIFPYLNALSSQIRGVLRNEYTSVTCPSYPNFVTFQLIKL